jgi:PAS domain S-box-containing protein
MMGVGAPGCMQSNLAFLAGESRLAALVRAKDWGSTPLGPPEGWPRSVKTAVSLCLSSRFPMLLWLGPELRILYNDAYVPFLGEAKHPAMLGAPGRDAWGEIWPTIAPMLDKARTGQATWAEDLRMFFSRRLLREEVYVTFSYSPILGEDGITVEGVLCTCMEMTGRVVGERQLSTLRSLGALQQHTAEAAAQAATRILEANPSDVPFAAIYLHDAEGRTVRRVAGVRLPECTTAFPAAQPLSGSRADTPWPFADVARAGGAIDVPDLPALIGTLAAPLWPEDAVRQAIVLPLSVVNPGSSPGFLVVGISPRRILDADYRTFLALTAEHVGAAILEARAFEDEHWRSEALAEIDRARTAFFSNVSQELRTSVMLILGPLQELLAKPAGTLPPETRALVAALRQDPQLATLSVILLSDRAGEEAQTSGMRNVADESFSAHELIARVEAVFARAGLRQKGNSRIWRSDAWLQAAVDLVGLSPYRWDPLAGTLEWDDRLRGMWGLPPGVQVEIDMFLQAIHPEDRPRVEAAMAACTDPAGDGVYHLEYRVIGIGDGVERWVSTHGRTSFENGVPVDFVGAVLDVTERKRVEERLRASEERFQQFADHSADLLWIVDAAAMQIEYRSAAFERIWGMPRDTAPNNLAHWAESIHPDDRAAVLDTLLRVQQGEPVVQEFRVLRPDGAVRWVRDTAFPILDELGRVHRIGGITVDVTRVEGAWIYIVDGEEASRLRLAALLHAASYDVKTFATTSGFLEVAPMLLPGCAVLELGGCGDEALLVPRELKARGIELPVIVVGGAAGDVRTAVQALKAGAADWLEGEHEPQALLAAVAAALAKVHDAQEAGRRTDTARIRIASMSQREREVLEGIVAGETNKEIARRLGISPRTVEIHRARVMERLGVRSLSEAVLLAAAAGLAGSRVGESK